MTRGTDSTMNEAQTTTPAVQSTLPLPRGDTGGVYGLRLRALLIAIPLVIGMSCLTVYGALSKTIPMGSFQIIPQAILALCALALMNRFLVRFCKKEFLSPGDLVVIYTM